MRTTARSPRRRVYETGGTLPEVTTDFRPVPLGFDSQGEPDEQIRAFAVSIRNRADSPVYIRESPEGDGAKVDRYESFDIWETNGVSSVEIRGENGGEQVEFRILEAHNDFDITDKIDAFVRAISHFLTQNKQETTITSTETNFDIGTINDGIDVDSINTDITVGTINDGITVDNGTISVDSIPNVTVDDILGDVTIGTITDGIDVDSIPNLTIDTINDGIAVDSGNVVIDDILATNASFDGDITGQTDFDLTAATREGRQAIRTVDGNGLSAGYFDSQLGSVIAEFYHYDIYDSAPNDGRIDRIEFRAFDYDTVERLGFILQIDAGDGNGYQNVSPRACFRAERAYNTGGPEIYTPRFYPNGDVYIVWEPDNPPTFSEGDAVAIEIGPHATTAGDGSYDCELEIALTDIVKKS